MLGSLLAVAWTIAMELRLVHREHVLSVGHDQGASREVALWADRVLPPRSLVVCMEMSGALKAYTRRPILRWDWIDPADVPRLAHVARSRGYLLYALLMPHEAEPAGRRLTLPWRTVGSRRGMTLSALEPVLP
jgi:hypothetical protein